MNLALPFNNMDFAMQIVAIFVIVYCILKYVVSPIIKLILFVGVTLIVLYILANMGIIQI